MFVCTYEMINEVEDSEPKEMFKYKMTNEIRDIVPIEILNIVKKIVNRLLEKEYVGKLREKTPVDRKESLLIIVEPIGDKSLIYTGYRDENNKYKTYGMLIEEVIIENVMLIDCSFGRNYNMLIRV